MARQLTKQQSDELDQACILYDKDGDNKLDISEVVLCMRSIGFSPTQADVKNYTAKVGNKKFDFKEVREFISRNAPEPETPAALADAFRIFDKDGSGYVSAAELRHVLEHLGEQLTDGEVDELIREVDMTGEGYVNYEDCVKIITSGQ